MPFIDAKITIDLDDAQKESLKAKFGKAVSIIGKPESYLMVGIDDGYDLYFAGDKMEKGAYVAVSLFGNAPSNAYESLTAEICKILEDDLGIPGRSVYVTYHGLTDWGWAGRNF